MPKHTKPENKSAIREVTNAELAAARQTRIERQNTVGLHKTAEWHHLERAHILSQPVAGIHVRTHLAMLGYAVRQRDGHEIAGQVARLLVAGPGSGFRRYPLGNTGGTNVRAMAPMPIPADLLALLAPPVGQTS